jgi:hypothetical protein
MLAYILNNLSSFYTIDAKLMGILLSRMAPCRWSHMAEILGAS